MMHISVSMFYNLRAVMWGNTKENLVFLTHTGSGNPVSSSAASSMIKVHNTKSGLHSSKSSGSRNLRRSVATIGEDRHMNETELAHKMDHSLATHTKHYKFNTGGKEQTLRELLIFKMVDVFFGCSINN